MRIKITSVFLTMLISTTIPALAKSAEECQIGDIDYDNLPLVLPDPGYVSELDVVAKRNSSTMDAESIYDSLSGAAQDFAFIRRTLGEWNSNLVIAEKAFWNKFDEQGAVTRKEQREYGYWLHRRELWTYTRSLFSNAVGSGLSNLFFSGFGHTAEMSRRAPLVDRPPRDYIDNPQYVAYFNSLSRYGFLENSVCSPKKDSSPRGQLLYGLMYPDKEGSRAIEKLVQLDEYLSANNKTYEEVLAYVDNGKLADTKKGTARYIDEFMQETTLEDVYLARVRFQAGVHYLDSPETGSNSLGFLMASVGESSTFKGYSISYGGMAKNTYGRGTLRHVVGKVDLEPFIGADLMTCIEPNSIQLSRRLLAKHGKRYATFATDRSKESYAMKLSLDAATIVSCANAGGLDNANVNTITTGFGFPLN